MLLIPASIGTCFIQNKITNKKDYPKLSEAMTIFRNNRVESKEEAETWQIRI